MVTRWGWWSPVTPAAATDDAMVDVFRNSWYRSVSDVGMTPVEVPTVQYAQQNPMLAGSEDFPQNIAVAMAEGRIVAVSAP